MAVHSFYPFVEQTESQGDTTPSSLEEQLCHPARIAVYDDRAAAPRVLVVEPAPIREYLEQISSEVSRLSREQGGSIPFMVIREVVENLIHAYFKEPAISILDAGQTIRFSDQGPGIQQKERALEYGTTSATKEMKKYIRGVGSGLPYAQQYLCDHGGYLRIEDNLLQGCIVTISLANQSPTHHKQDKKEDNTARYSLLTDDELTILNYALSHEYIGPTDLVNSFGKSTATWSRRLKTLEEKELIEKGRQKFRITTSGRELIQN